MRYRSYALFISVICLLNGVATGQDHIVKKVDEFIRAEMESQHIPGVSLAVIKDGKPVIVKGYGLANVEHNVPVKPETVFQSGSVAKQFTATAVMMLVENGKVDLDKPIGTYLGDVPDTWAGITVRHLLSHTGGMTDYPDDFDYRRDYTEDELLKQAKEIPLAFKAGDRWMYSNLGYVVLGILIHKVSGKFYGDLLQERVFKPLGMTSARIINEADIIPNRAAGYRLVKGQLKNQAWVSPSINTTADGSLYLTVYDMIKWDEALSAGKLLRRSSFDEMCKPVKLNNGKIHPYGFGWAVREVNGKTVVEHGGAWQGFKAHIARFPENRITVVLFANLIQTNQYAIAHGVAEIVEPELKPKPVVDADAAFSARTKELLQAVLENKADLSRFTPNVQREITIGRDRIYDFVGSMGALLNFSLVERESAAGVDRYRYQLVYTGMNVFLELEVNKDGKISSFALQPE